MIGVLATLSVVLAVVIVLVVAYHLVGVFVALKRAGNHLEELAAALVEVRDATEPLNERITSVNTGLAALVGPLAASGTNLKAIVRVAAGLRNPDETGT